MHHDGGAETRLIGKHPPLAPLGNGLLDGDTRRAEGLFCLFAQLAQLIAISVAGGKSRQFLRYFLEHLVGNLRALGQQFLFLFQDRLGNALRSGGANLRDFILDFMIGFDEDILLGVPEAVFLYCSTCASICARRSPASFMTAAVNLLSRRSRSATNCHLKS